MSGPTSCPDASAGPVSGATRPAAPEYTPDAVLPALFAATAERHADRVAIDVPPRDGRPRSTTTYAALEARADAVARGLRPFARRDGLIAILLPRDAIDLYAAQLGIQAAGSAFVCLDPRFPDAALAAILDDAAPLAVVTDGGGARRIAGIPGGARPVFDVARLGAAGDAMDGVAAAVHGSWDSWPAPHDLAYVVYTSGTTGDAKGVMIEQASIVNLVRSDRAAFDLGPGDRIAQVSSPAYDSSIEETWLALASGATLVLMDDETVRSGPDLSAWLRRERITVLCPPPTLLRALGPLDPAADLPELRLLYVGGEPLPPDVAARWAPACRLENGYGPTECTVTVTRARIRPGAPVTIGRPIEGHRAWILDPALAEMPDGEAGELCLGGIGLARGYLGRPAQTRERFLDHPALGRIYRTGDLARRGAHGDLEHLGRLDDQVKLRGYRIELGAVEAALAALPGVRAAACAVQGQGPGAHLVAHLVLDRPGEPFDEPGLRTALRRVLPDPMVPALLAPIARLPTTAGGKLDRRALPAVAREGAGTRAGPGSDSGQAYAAPGAGAPRRRTDEPSAAALWIAAAFAAALDLRAPPDPADDFFLDLGGDSLSAVAVINALREAPETAALAVRDIYALRTAAALATRLAAGRPDGDADGDADGEVARFGREGAGRAGFAPDAWQHPRGTARPRAATALQAAWLLAELLLGSGALWALVGQARAMALHPSARPFVLPGGYGMFVLAPLLAFLAVAAYAAISVVLLVVAKRLLIGRYEAMRTPVWSGPYVRHWLVMHLARLVPWAFVQGTGLQVVVLRLLGARIGRRVHIGRGVDLARGGWDLLSVDDGASLGRDSALRTAELSAGHLLFGPVVVGARATLETRAALSPYASLGRDAVLTALSWLPPGHHVPDGERWDGSPALPDGLADAPPPGSGRPLSPAAFTAATLAARAGTRLIDALPLAGLALLAGWAAGIAPVDVRAWLAAPELTAGLVMAGAVLPVIALPASLGLDALILRALGRVRGGTVDARSLDAVRIWLKTWTVERAGRWLSGSLLWPLWLRMAGMTIGRGCEISTLIDAVPELVAIGDGSFFADGVYLAAPRVHRGTIDVRATRLGRRTFLGNHAVVPSGYHGPDDLFLGVATVAPAPGGAAEGAAWFGHPPMALPSRDVVLADRRLTHEPGLARWSTRAFWESLRLLLPMPPMIATVAWLAVAAAPRTSPLGVAMASLALLAAPCAAVFVLKWLLLGRVKPGQHAFWSCWCGRWDFLYVAWGHWARLPLSALEGTLLLNASLRAFGMRIGRRVVLGDGFAHVVDPDMLRFEDGATVACQFQAHSFEDRILKIDHVTLREGATVGAQTVVFYGADIGAAAQVAPNGVVMKHDRLPAGACYAGSPARRVRAGA